MSKCGDPVQTGIATTLRCLFAHNLVFDTNDLKLNLTNLYLWWYVYLSLANYP